MTQIIYGSELSAELKENMRSKVESWVSTGMRTPCLAVILVGDNPASESYVRGKEKACAAVGIKTNTIRLSSSISQEELEKSICDCTNDDTVDGILIQLPLPEGFNEVLRRYGLQVEEGIFAADMKVELLNDGPITIWLDSEDLK